MRRRDFLGQMSAAGGGVLLAGGATAAAAAASPSRASFTLDYAPHLGMFGDLAGDDPIDQLRFMHERGFRSLEDNGMRDRSVAEQQRIAAELGRLDMRLGVFVLNPATAWTTTFAAGSEDFRESFLRDTRASIEVAQRVGARWMTVVMGTVAPRLEPEYQTANAVEILRAAAALLEPHDRVMVLEPLTRDRTSVV